MRVGRGDSIIGFLLKPFGLHLRYVLFLTLVEDHEILYDLRHSISHICIVSPSPSLMRSPFSLQKSGEKIPNEHYSPSSTSLVLSKLFLQVSVWRESEVWCVKPQEIKCNIHSIILSATSCTKLKLCKLWIRTIVSSILALIHYMTSIKTIYKKLYNRL